MSTPRQKLEIVQARQAGGEVAAITGDGGRRSFHCGRRRGGGPPGVREHPPVLLYGPACGAAEIAVMLAGPFLGLALPLLPAQILWVNLLTHACRVSRSAASPRPLASCAAHPAHRPKASSAADWLAVSCSE